MVANKLIDMPCIFSTKFHQQLVEKLNPFEATFAIVPVGGKGGVPPDLAFRWQFNQFWVNCMACQ
jgi:hypothetical protein